MPSGRPNSATRPSGSPRTSGSHALANRRSAIFPAACCAAANPIASSRFCSPSRPPAAAGARQKRASVRGPAPIGSRMVDGMTCWLGIRPIWNRSTSEPSDYLTRAALGVECALLQSNSEYHSAKVHTQPRAQSEPLATNSTGSGYTGKLARQVNAGWGVVTSDATPQPGVNVNYLSVRNTLAST